MLVDTEDYLQDVAFDYYSKKMAICSSDRRIKIYSKTDYKANQDFSSQWDLDFTWEAHDAPVWRVVFSHPEFGPVLASCGFDKRVNIWQEKTEDGNIVWINKAKIQEFSDNVEDISFCPRTYGLKLAVCTLNGRLKIFEPKDYLFNVNWNCIYQKELSYCCSSICWNPSSLDPKSFVLGFYNTQVTKESPTKHPVNPSSSNQSSQKASQNPPNVLNPELLQIYVYCDSKKDYICEAVLSGPKGHTDSITFVEWAPQFGRSYHLLATCSLDRKINIWRFELSYEFASDSFRNVSVNKDKVECVFSTICPFPVYRVSWNVAGNILTSMDSNGNIRIFKKVEDEFVDISEIEGICQSKENTVQTDRHSLV